MSALAIDSRTVTHLVRTVGPGTITDRCPMVPANMRVVVRTGLGGPDHDVDVLGGTTYRALFEALSINVGEGAVTWAMGRRVSLDE